MRYLISAAAAAMFIFAFMVYKTFSRPLPLAAWFKQTAAVIATPGAQAGDPSDEADSKAVIFKRAADDRRLLTQILSATEINIADIVNQDDATVAQLFKESKDLAAKLSTCLSGPDLCGQTKEKAEGYFDPNHTPEHRNLNRVLMVMGEIAKIDPSYLHELNRDDLIRVTKINNDNAPILALQLLGRTKMTEDEMSTVLANTKNLRGQTRSIVLEHLAQDETQKTPSVRANYVAAVYDAVSNTSDRATAFEVQKNLGRFKLQKEEFTQAVSKSCFLRKDGMGEDMWPLLKKNIALQGEALGFVINPDDYCK